MKTNIYMTSILFCLFFTNAGAQVSIDGEIRPRAEYRQGFRKPLSDTLSPSFITLQRTRLNLDYKSKVLNARIIIQDSRIWGNNDTKSSGSKIEIYEAWAEYLIYSGLSAKFGRQVLKYDDQRLFGAAAWSNTGLAHDLLLLKYNTVAGWQAHAGFAYNNSKDTLMDVNYTVTKMYKTLGFLWLSKTFSNGINTTLITVEEGLQKPNDNKTVYSRFTSGGNITYQNDSSRLSFKVLGYYQVGKSSSFNDLNAFLAAVKIGYKFYKSNTFFIGMDYYSGTKSNAVAGSSSTFNKLYGANHSFNGNMEYWTSIPKSGLIDYYGGMGVKIIPKISSDVTFHFFSLGQEYIVNSMNINKNMGSELDVILNYNLCKEISVQAGYCTYFNSASTDDYFSMSGANLHQSQWAYLMLTIVPNFYRTPVAIENK